MLICMKFQCSTMFLSYCISEGMIWNHYNRANADESTWNKQIVPYNSIIILHFLHLFTSSSLSTLSETAVAVVLRMRNLTDAADKYLQRILRHVRSLLARRFRPVLAECAYILGKNVHLRFLTDDSFPSRRYRSG